MDISVNGITDIRADRETVWRSLLDPEVIRKAATAIEAVEQIDDSHFSLIAGVGIGAFKLRFRMTAELSEVVPKESAKLRLHGKAPASTLDAMTSFRLEELGAGTIRLHWRTDSEVGGIAAGLGVTLLEATARRLTTEFWQDFATIISKPAARA